MKKHFELQWQVPMVREAAVLIVKYGTELNSKYLGKVNICKKQLNK